jgi:hypothetical protein
LNTLELKEFNGNQVVYYYQPEGKGVAGEVIYVFSTGEPETIRRAENDVSGRYAHMAENKVKEYVNKNNLPIKSTQMWY